MKKSLVIALVLVLSLSALSLAAGWPGENQVQGNFDVKVNILPYAYAVVPETLDLGDINFFESFDKQVTTNIELYTNTDVRIRFDSAGFDYTRFEDEQRPLNPIGYNYQMPDNNPHGLWEMFNAGSGKGGPGGNMRASKIQWSGDVINIPFRVKIGTINSDFTPENFYKIKAGDYTDTITLTVTVD